MLRIEGLGFGVAKHELLKLNPELSLGHRPELLFIENFQVKSLLLPKPNSASQKIKNKIHLTIYMLNKIWRCQYQR